MGYISVYYNVASQDKANYLPRPPPQRGSLCYSHHFCTVKKKTYLFYAYPSRKRWWRKPHFISRGAHSFSYILRFFKHLFLIGSFGKTLPFYFKFMH